MILSALMQYFQNHKPTGLVLLTRAFEDSLHDAQLLESLGLRTFIEPMLEIYPIFQDDKQLKEARCVITTSAHAIKIIRPFMEERLNTPLWCVGGASAKVAKSLGFQHIHLPHFYGGKELVSEFIKTDFDKDNSIFYASGNYVSIPVDDLLKQEGYNVTRIVVYQTIYIDHFRPHVKKAFQSNEIETVLFYSVQALRTFLKVHQEGNLANLQAICISEQIGKVAYEGGFKKIVIFDKKDKKFTNFLPISRLQ